MSPLPVRVLANTTLRTNVTRAAEGRRAGVVDRHRRDGEAERGVRPEVRRARCTSPAPSGCPSGQRDDPELRLAARSRHARDDDRRPARRRQPEEHACGRGWARRPLVVSVADDAGVAADVGVVAVAVERQRRAELRDGEGLGAPRSRRAWSCRRRPPRRRSVPGVASSGSSTVATPLAFVTAVASEPPIENLHRLARAAVRHRRQRGASASSRAVAARRRRVQRERGRRRAAPGDLERGGDLTGSVVGALVVVEADEPDAVHGLHEELAPAPVRRRTACPSTASSRSASCVRSSDCHCPGVTPVYVTQTCWMPAAGSPTTCTLNSTSLPETSASTRAIVGAAARAAEFVAERRACRRCRRAGGSVLEKRPLDVRQRARRVGPVLHGREHQPRARRRIALQAAEVVDAPRPRREEGVGDERRVRAVELGRRRAGERRDPGRVGEAAAAEADAAQHLSRPPSRR